MVKIPPFLTAPAWANNDVDVYHGTLDLYATSIRRSINPSLGNPRTDFGLGFYTTTILRQARAWAWQMAIDYNALTPVPPRLANPVVVRFRVPRDELASLEWLVFARGDSGHSDYWSFVQYCRSGGHAHGRRTPPNMSPWYDGVAGPVAAFWRTRLAISNSDQFSFHTPKAAAILDRSRKRVLKVSMR